MGSPNKISVDSYEIDLTTDAVSLVAQSGTAHKFAKRVFLRAANANGGNVLLGSRDRQEYVLDAGESVDLDSVLNRMSQSAKFSLSDIFVKTDNATDVLMVLVIDPTMD